MQLSEIGIAGWTMAIGFLIIGSSPPPAFEASARPGGAVDLPIQFNTEPSSKTQAANTVFENCQNPLAAALSGQETSGSPSRLSITNRAGVETTGFTPRRMGIANAGTSQCIGCLVESQVANSDANGRDCTDHDLALLTLQF